MDEIYLSVVIPAYNEEERMGKAIESIAAYLARQPYRSEIIVSDGGSTDNTAEAVRRKMLEIRNLSVISRKNKGKGEGVKDGMLAAKGRIRLFTDADNSTDMSHFDKMRPFFDQGYEVVIASRDPKDAPGARQAVSQSWWKRMLGAMGNRYIQHLAVRGIWDTQCGFKAFRGHAAEQLFGVSRVDRWAFDVEILALTRRLNFKIGIIPAYWGNDPKTHVTLSGYLKSLWEVFKIHQNLKYH